MLLGADPFLATPPFDRADGAATFLDEDEDEAFFLTDWLVERKADFDVVGHLSLFEVRVAGRAWSPSNCDCGRPALVSAANGGRRRRPRSPGSGPLSSTAGLSADQGPDSDVVGHSGVAVAESEPRSSMGSRRNVGETERSSSGAAASSATRGAAWTVLVDRRRRTNAIRTTLDRRPMAIDA